MFYAVGYTNNGANEKKLGPFTTKDEAMKAGRSEAGITRGFSFSGVIDDSGNYVYHNSRACNSTNPVVANAMRARNATYQYHDYDVPVIQLGQRKYITIMGVADEETAKALARSSPGITIDESRKVKVKNASGSVARNATAFNIGTFASRLTRIVQDIEKVEYEIIAAMPDEIEAPQEYAKIERELLVPIQQAKQAFRRF